MVRGREGGARCSSWGGGGGAGRLVQGAVMRENGGRLVKGVMRGREGGGVAVGGGGGRRLVRGVVMREKDEREVGERCDGGWGMEDGGGRQEGERGS